jgi:16S rRNA (cytidine1402-2'-O)-methyltransferase
MSSTRGKLYLIPTPLSPEDGMFTLPDYVIAQTRELRVFIVEKHKTARAFLRQMEFPVHFDECRWFELNKFTEPKDIPGFIRPATEEGLDIGLMSEAGAPAIADPGAKIVRLAYRYGVEVVPMVGPSAILLALMASGLSGQRFTFHGYLSPKRPQLAKDLKKLEAQSLRNQETQLWIEAPYRNKMVFETAMAALSQTTSFGFAADLTLPTQLNRVHTIMEWKRMRAPDLHKRPAVFVLMGNK